MTLNEKTCKYLFGLPHYLGYAEIIGQVWISHYSDAKANMVKFQ